MISKKLGTTLLAAVSLYLSYEPAYSQFGQGRGAGLQNLLGGKRQVDSKYIFYEQWTDAKRSRTIPIKIYLPTDRADAVPPYPVVIFSHGLGGSVEAAPYLAEAWIKAGYFCIFIQHPGSDSDVWKPALTQGKSAMMGRLKEAANPQNLIDRIADVKFVIDELERRNNTDAKLKGQLDLSKIAMTGHSFGAGTTLGIAGQSYPGGRTATDARVKAAIYLCPPVNVNRVVKGQTYAQIKIPGLLLTGTEDNSPIGDTKAEDRRIPFDGIVAPHQYLVNFKGANHATFGGSRGFRSGGEDDARFQVMIAKVTTEFLDAALKNERSAWQWLDGKAAGDYLGTAAVYERK